MGCLLGEYFQVHPYKSIEDGLPMGESIFKFTLINLLKMGCLWESIFKFTLINLLSIFKYTLTNPWVAYGRVFSSSPL